MATITALRLAYKQAGDITDCKCLRIVRKDGTIYRLTALDKDLIITTKNNLGVEQALPASVTYKAASIADFSAYGNSMGEFGQIDIEGVLESTGFLRADIVNGLFDRARIYIFTTNYNRPIEDEEPLMSGFWGEVTLIDGRFIAKFSSLIDTISLTTGRVYQASCDAQLGSFRCGVKLTTIPNWTASTAYTVSNDNDKRLGSIVKPTVDNGYYYKCTVAGTSSGSQPSWTAVEGALNIDGAVTWEAIIAYQSEQTVFNVLDTKEIQFVNTYDSEGVITNGRFTNGYIELTSGGNTGLKIPVERSTQPTSPGNVATLYLLFEPPNPIVITDTFILTIGCNKTKTACTDKFLNAYNYQGFTDVPGRVAFVQGGIN